MEAEKRNIRIIRYEITPAQAGMTVREYLNKKVKLSHHQISSLKFREDGIVLNGVTSRVTCVLQSGDILEIGLKDAGNGYLVPGDFTTPPDVLYEDADMLIVNKPSGMVCHPSPGHYADTLANQVAAWAKQRGEDWTIRLIGRLDGDTSGIVIFAKNSETAALLTRQREEGRMEKIYLALCEGRTEKAGRVNLPILKDEERLGKMKTGPLGKPAVTHYQRIFAGESASFLQIKIEHGRTHQIRVHMAAIGHPLLGDPFYGSGVVGRDHALLHAWKTTLEHPFTGEILDITAPVPEYFWNIMEIPEAEI